jgi:poly(3-hydroxybutyrate) depolymerase
MKALFLVLLMLLSFNMFAQQNYCIQNRFSEGYYFDSSQIQVTTDIRYAIAKRWPSTVNDTLKLDVFAPILSEDSLVQRPFILLIHGGAFLSGNRSQMNYQCMEYARRGFVVATMSYRLGWNCSATDLLGVCVACQGENYKLQTATYRAAQDARAALRFISANASTYGIDTSWIFVGGESAGSITALHAAFWDQSEANAFASFAAAQVGLLDTAGNNLPNNFSIKAVIDNCGAVSRDSIVLNNGSIPVVSFHDENDCVVPTNAGQVISCVCQPFYWAWGSSSIHSIMDRASICNEMNLVPASLNHCSYPTWNLVKHASCFLKRVMCNDCQSSFTNNTSATVRCDTLSSTFITSNIKIDPSYSVRYFPNPSEGNITFDFTNLMQEGKLTLSITDMSGRVVENVGNIDGASYTLSSSLQPGGVYFYSVTSGSKVLARGKLISN